MAAVSNIKVRCIHRIFYEQLLFDKVLIFHEKLVWWKRKTNNLRRRHKFLICCSLLECMRWKICSSLRSNVRSNLVPYTVDTAGKRSELWYINILINFNLVPMVASASILSFIFRIRTITFCKRFVCSGIILFHKDFSVFIGKNLFEFNQWQLYNLKENSNVNLKKKIENDKTILFTFVCTCGARLYRCEY